MSAPAPAVLALSGRGLAGRGRLADGLLAAAVVVGLYGLDWVALAPNRLVSGRGLSATGTLGGATHLLALSAIVATASGWSSGRRSRLATAAALTAMLAVAAALPLLTAGAAATLLQGRPPAARVTLAAGFWLASAGTFGLILSLADRLGGRGLRIAAAAGALAAVTALGLAGTLDTLSLVAEIRARGDLVAAALARHLALAAASLALALAIAVPLGWAAFRSARVDALASLLLRSIQVVPALALMAALIPVLSRLLAAAPALRGLGLAAIGPAPAVLAVGAYLALPLVASITTALRSADAAVLDAGRGMGLGEARLTREVRLPLGLPILAAGLRVGTVQSIGLVTLGGLVGAGGLGAVVFEGMGQFAPDLILIGAAPIVALALAADWGLGTIEARLARATGAER